MSRPNLAKEMESLLKSGGAGKGAAAPFLFEDRLESSLLDVVTWPMFLQEWVCYKIYEPAGKPSILERQGRGDAHRRLLVLMEAGFSNGLSPLAWTMEDRLMILELLVTEACNTHPIRVEMDQRYLEREGCVFVNIYTSTYVSIYLRVYVCIYVCVYVSTCVCMYVSMYVRMYLSM